MLITQTYTHALHLEIDFYIQNTFINTRFTGNDRMILYEFIFHHHLIIRCDGLARVCLFVCLFVCLVGCAVVCLCVDVFRSYGFFVVVVVGFFFFLLLLFLFFFILVFFFFFFTYIIFYCHII